MKNKCIQYDYDENEILLSFNISTEENTFFKETVSQK